MFCAVSFVWSTSPAKAVYTFNIFEPDTNVILLVNVTDAVSQTVRDGLKLNVSESTELLFNLQ